MAIERLLPIDSSYGDFNVRGPELCALNPEATAKSIMAILSANYGTHNLSSAWEPLARDIINGRILPFVSFDTQGNPVACAALIKQNDHDVEIGRGACLPSMNGGHARPLLLAAQSWESGTAFPESKILRAEVRTAKPTREVQGGQATQVICLEKIGLVPTAIGPFFHHGNPDRQEIFILASKCKEFPIVSAAVPSNIFANKNEARLFEFFWFNQFGKRPSIVPMEGNGYQTPSFSVHREGPLLVFVHGDETVDVNSEIKKAFSEGIRFAIARVRLTESIDNIAKSAASLRGFGFKMMGFEPVFADDHFEIEILFGRLSETGKGRLVAPCFVERIFPHEIEDLLLIDSIKWRRNEK